MDLTEWNYLQRFARTADEEAFAFLVQRYGSLVLGVCRRQTGDVHLAEDAFQATFLVLARRAGDLDQSEPLASWLFGVALRTARQMRSRRYERNRREQDAAVMKTPSEPRMETKVDEAALEPLIDSALLELPEPFARRGAWPDRSSARAAARVA
jgi:RNA polymerase sigma factor (sigma-70 family)